MSTRRLAVLLLLPTGVLTGVLASALQMACSRNPHVAAPASGPVTARNLLERDRYWPYRVELVRAWQPPAGGASLPARAVGVLVRVEPEGVARIDFGRRGRHEVPVAETDLVERADRIRRGELAKGAPNFLLAVGTRLADSAGESLAPFRYRDVPGLRGALCVFADPDDESFEELAAALAPLRDRPALLTILFPQGEHADAEVRERLRSLGWTVPFVFDHYSEAYTRSLVGDAARFPSVLLQTTEGRLLFQSAWHPGAASEVTAAADEAFGRAGEGRVDRAHSAHGAARGQRAPPDGRMRG